MKLSKKSGLKFRARARFARNCFKGKFQTKTRFLATVCLPSGRPRFWDHTILDSLSQQRSAGRGLGRGDFELKTSSPRPSPPASLGGEGVSKGSGVRRSDRTFARVENYDHSQLAPQLNIERWRLDVECSRFHSNFDFRSSDFLPC